MARHHRGFDSDGPSAEATLYNTVFVDTSLDTHIVLIVSSSDTVSDFKKMILLQHSESFPSMGGVNIHSVQVKRQGLFYHLPDSMLVSSAFSGSKKTWFLFVEASYSEEDEKEQLSNKLDDASENCSLLHQQNHPQGDCHNVPVDDPLKLASEKVPQAVQACPRHFSGEISRDIVMEVGHLQDDCQKELSSDIGKSLALPGAALEKNIRVSENAACSEGDDSRDNNKTTVVSGLEELPSAVKKHKMKHIENVEFSMKKKRKVEDKKDPLVEARGKDPSDIQTRKIRGECFNSLSSDANWMLISGVQKTSESETNAEQSEKLEREEVNRDQSNSTNGEHVTKREKVPSLQEGNEDNLVTGVSSKKEKKKQKKILSVPHDQAALDGSVSQQNLNTEAPEAKKNEGHVELVLRDDPEVMVSQRCNPLDEGEIDGTNEESIPSPNFMGTSSPTEGVDSARTKMKKTRTKKKALGSARERSKITGATSSTVVDLAPKDSINDWIVNHKSMLSLDESQKNNRVENERVLSHNDDPQVKPSECFIPSDQVEAPEMNKGPIPSHLLSPANEVAEAGNSSTIKRKKRKAKNSAAKLQEKSDVDNLPETSLPAEGVVLDVELNDATSEKNKTVPHIERELENDSEQVEAPEMNKGSILSFNLSLANEVAEAGNSSTIKRKKRKAKNSAAKLQEKLDVDNLPETSLPAEGLVLDVEMNGVTSEKNKTVPHIERELENGTEQVEAPEMNKGSILSFNLSLANEVAEAGNSSTIKRKKRKAKNSAAKLQEKSDVDNLPETSLPAEGVVLDVEMNGVTSEKNKTVPHIERELENDTEQVEAPEMNKGSILPFNLSLANEVAEAGNSSTIKRKKRKAKNSAAKLQEKSDVDNLPETSLPAEGVVLDVEMNGVNSEKNKNVPHIERELENDTESSSRHKSEVVLPEGNKLLDSGKAIMNDKESGFAEMSWDDKYGLEAGKSGRSHKKKWVKTHPITKDDISAMGHCNPVNASPAKHFEEDIGLPLKHGPEMISSEAKTLDLGEATVNHSESGFTSKVLDNENGTEAGKSGGRQKKKRAKKCANSVCDASAKHIVSEAQGNQSISNFTEENNKLKKESGDVSHASKSKASVSKKIVSPLAETNQTLETAIDLNDNLREAENDQSMDTNALQDQLVKLQANEVQHLLHDEADKEQENAENIKKKVKKTKRKQNNAADTQSNSKTNGQNTCIEELAVSGDKMGDGDHPYNAMNTNASAEMRIGGEGINFRDYFVPEEHQNENASANKVKEALHSTEAKRKTKKPNFVSDGTVKSNLQRHQSNTHDNQLEESSADAKGSQDVSGAYKEIPQASKSHDVDKEKTPWKATKLVVANGSVAASSSSSSAKGSKRAFQDTTNKKQQSGYNKGGTSDRKFSSKNDGDIVNCSQQKSLLSAAIFHDDSSESSEDENRYANSDASTRTPSDNLSSLGNSDGESELSQGSRGNGSENAKIKDGRRKCSLNSKFPDRKAMSMEMIFKSSKRFKKAKLTASQSQEADIESQPVDFVPDSQAN